MSTPWYEIADNPAGITTHYDDPPALEEIIVREFDGSAYFDQCSFRLWFDLPAPPENLPAGSTFSVALYFMHLQELRFSTNASSKRTTLKVERRDNNEIRVRGMGATQLHVICESFLIESVSASNAENRAERTRNLSSYHQLWNSCLIELAEFGYELAFLGSPDADGTTANCSFIATKDSVRLVGRNPVELVGLATLHSRFPDFDHESKLWRRAGPDLIQKITDDWEQQWCKPNS